MLCEMPGIDLNPYGQGKRTKEALTLYPLLLQSPPQRGELLQGVGDLLVSHVPHMQPHLCDFLVTCPAADA